MSLSWASALGQVLVNKPEEPALQEFAAQAPQLAAYAAEKYVEHKTQTSFLDKVVPKVLGTVPVIGPALTAYVTLQQKADQAQAQVAAEKTLQYASMLSAADQKIQRDYAAKMQAAGRTPLKFGWAEGRPPFQGADTMFSDSTSFDFGTFAGDIAKDLLRAVINKNVGPTSAAPAIPDYGWQPVQTTGVTPTMGVLPRLPALGAGIVAGARRIGGRLMTAAGQYISRTKAVRLAKLVGIQGAAAALGVGALELAQAVVDEEGKRRRGRGISAAQLRTTVRTIGKLERAHVKIARAARTHVRRTK